MTAMQAERLSLDGAQPIPLEQVLPLAQRGDIIRLRGCLQAIGSFDTLRELALDCIAHEAGRAKADQVRKDGFETVHAVLTPGELVASTERIARTCSGIAPALLRTLLQQELHHDHPFYFESLPHVRFHIPYDAWVRGREAFTAFSRRRGDGKLTVHGPHRDGWHACPANGINVWTAIGGVQPGNSLAFYPRSYGVPLVHTSHGELALGQAPGPYMDVTLSPGDAIVFHGEHLHSSELNRTDQTRFVISFRTTLNRPAFPAPTSHHYVRSDSMWASGRSALDIGRMLNRLHRLTRRVMRRLTAPELPHPDLVPSSQSPAPLIHPKETGTGQLAFPASELPEGTIKPLTASICVARSEGKVTAFGRRCPHQCADLSAGYLQNGCITCPWHIMPFKLQDGSSPCSALRPLARFPCTEQAGMVTVDPRPGTAPKDTGI